MRAKLRKALPLLAGVFFGMGLYELVMGGTWVVWFILAFLLGAFSAFGLIRRRRPR